MKFTLPCKNDFVIPDEWWSEAKMLNFIRKSASYLTESDPEVRIINIEIIKPPRRDPGFEFDSNGFYKERLIKVLGGFVNGDLIPPIKVQRETQGLFNYSVREGFHRFYASAAAGFELIPAVVIEP